jgi:hypothetical protein
MDLVGEDRGPAHRPCGGDCFILQLEGRDGTPVRGTIAPVGEDGAALRFDGWVELMSAVETLRLRGAASSSSSIEQGFPPVSPPTRD